jgi:O-antigen biosynthesis protein
MIPNSETKTLSQIYGEHSGRVSDKWGSYLEAYEQLLQARRDSVESVLEIGVQNGGSLEVWAKYFPKAHRIVGCDIEPKCGSLSFADDRISVVVGDATTAETREKIRRISHSFDLIIDDGSHKSSEIIKCFPQYFGLLNEGGLYVVEDLHCSYWTSHDGGLSRPFSAMDFLKALADLPNFEHWAVDLSRTQYLADFAEAHAASFDEGELARIHSVGFTNSICMISKEASEKNLLGKRIVAGRIEDVMEGALGWNGQESITSKAVSQGPIQKSARSECELEIAELRRQHKELSMAHRGILNSMSWRLCKPLRSIEKRIKALKRSD